jgi:hypothetical protein
MVPPFPHRDTIVRRFIVGDGMPGASVIERTFAVTRATSCL